MLQRLFTSRVRVKILTLFMMNPGQDFFLREITRRTKENSNSVRRELENLEDLGLLKSRKEGNMKYFSINTDYPIYPELKSMIMKTGGVSKSLKELLVKIGYIELAFIYGSFASGEADKGSDLDLFIVGDIDENQLLKGISQLEGSIGREINYVLFNRQEFDEKVEKGDMFVINVLESPKLMIIGDLNVG